MHAEPVDLAVIGAGPAGLAAATRAAATGLSVVLLDEQDAVGGQIYRAIERSGARRRAVLGPDYAAGADLAAAFARSGARHVPNASVWQVTRERSVHYLQDGKVGSFAARRVVLATGALERPFPIPGWTLPGVMTAGAAQILLKGAGEVPAEPPVLVGCGPLLYLLAWQYVQAGVKVRAVVDTTRSEDRWRAKRHLIDALRAWPMLSKGLRMIRTLRAAGVPIHEAADDLRIEGVPGEDGTPRAQTLRFSVRGVPQSINANLFLLHQGVVPNTQFSWAVRASHRWDDAQLCFVPATDEWGELDVEGLFVAGDGAGIGGAQVAALAGELSALAVAAQLGTLDAAARDRAAAPLRRRLADALRIRPFLDSLYRAREENRVPREDSVTVCRCEEVSAGEVRRIVALGCLGPNQAKSFSRCGMGPCQGRLCGLTVTETIAQARGVSPAEVGYYRVRPPIKPLTLGELASGE
ncbi:FAD/NAD(P)-binding oxidoreductase [Burkholderia sp. WAC0059]|uniref:FAD/NAD(P)-dependent oxidoreductase n=1 Tax=Burkholderia sp. WAC0059 TaxID=2066022 RepID=UPI000C7F0CFA|nr:NAD(P)/FAD-dependent oxidoreductase [Burkholderia sp. WAC0059]PLZ03160.1 FAD/NAD(P)-binding oxidoreductase [Burkholderia sp. WAC0059]